jgi:hypothetical protein
LRTRVFSDGKKEIKRIKFFDDMHHEKWAEKYFSGEKKSGRGHFMRGTAPTP